MPRVSEQYLESRRRQILEAARRCFVRDGFHRTSMQDIFAESGLSAGAVYRYFRSKDELIDAIATRAGETADDLFEEALAERPAPAVHEVVGRVVERIASAPEARDRGRIAILAWAEALRDPTAGRFIRELFATLRGHLVEVARRAQAAGRLDPKADPTLVGQAAFSLLLGFMLQRTFLGGPTPDTYREGVAMLAAGSLRTPPDAPSAPARHPSGGGRR